MDAIMPPSSSCELLKGVEQLKQLPACLFIYSSSTSRMMIGGDDDGDDDVDSSFRVNKLTTKWNWINDWNWI